MLTSDTKRRIDSCRDILVGKLPLPTDQVELITLALIYKFMDDLDEESVTMGGRRSFFTGPLAPYRWRELMSQTLSAEERMTRFADGLELLGGGKKLRLPKKAPKRGEEPTEEVDVAAHLPALFRDIFRNAFLKFRDGRILTLFLSELSGFAYSHSEELGNAFEYILSVMGAQGDNGQFRTPRHVIDFMVACLDPQPGQTVLDPACGTGGFLVSAFRHIRKQHTSPDSTIALDRLTHTQRQKLYAAFTGYDINDQMVKLSRVNLFLHEFATPQIHIYDTLTNDARWPERYDLILANPPFMTPKGGVVPHTRFRVPAKKSEVLFTDYIAEHLTPDGRAGVIVPNGIVATTQTAYVKLRRFLVEESLVAVVSLPAGCFKPYSGVKTSILLLDKKLARTTDRILFLKIAADGFDLGDKRTPIEANDLPEAERVIRAWLTGKLGDDFASPLAWKLVNKTELLDDEGTSLSAERFLGGDITQSVVERVKLGDIATFEYGHTAVAGDSGDARYIRITDIDEYGRLRSTDKKFIALDDDARASLAKAGDVFVARIGATAGKTLLFASDETAVFASYLIRVRFDPAKMLPEFYWCLTRSAEYWVQREQLVSGGGQPQLNANALKLIEIPLPPLEEQRRIVAEIEGCQQVIDGARQILAAYKPTIAISPDWEPQPFGEICENLDSRRRPITKGVRTAGQYPYYGASGIVDYVESYLFDEPLLLVSEDGANLLARSTPIAFSVSGKIWVNNHAHVLRFASMATQKFVECYLNSIPLENYVTGAAQPKLNQQALNSIPIPLPPKPEQERIVAELEAEAAKVEAVRGLLPLYEAKIQRTLARVWGTGV